MIHPIKQVKLRVHFQNLNPGEIAGFPAPTADRLIAAGLAIVWPPAPVETPKLAVIADPPPVAAANVKPIKSRWSK